MQARQGELRPVAMSWSSAGAAYVGETSVASLDLLGLIQYFGCRLRRSRSWTIGGVVGTGRRPATVWQARESPGQAGRCRRALSATGRPRDRLVAGRAVGGRYWGGFFISWHGLLHPMGPSLWVWGQAWTATPCRRHSCDPPSTRCLRRDPISWQVERQAFPLTGTCSPPIGLVQ